MPDLPCGDVLARLRKRFHVAAFGATGHGSERLGRIPTFGTLQSVRWPREGWALYAAGAAPSNDDFSRTEPCRAGTGIRV
jgi:hypothetical protein